MSEMNIAVLGCGAWGKNHLRVWSELGHLRIACDMDPSRLGLLRTQYPDVEMSSDTTAVVDRADISAVAIATPAPTHAMLAQRALEAGKDVLVEKPMALNVEEAKRLVATAQRLNRILMVGHVLEYHPAVRRLRELVAEGSLGRVRYIYSNRLSLGRIRTEENALWSFAPHDVAIMLRLMGVSPELVACHGVAFLNQGVADVTMTNLYFPGNVRGHIYVSWLHPFKEQRFVVVGDRQMAVFDDTRSWPEKLALYPHQVNWLNGQIPVAHRAEAMLQPLEETEPLRAECEEFVRCAQTRTRPLTDGQSGLNVLRVLEAAQHSLEEKGRTLEIRVSDDGKVATSYYVHPTAIVEAGAEIGDGSRIWHQTHIRSGAKVGRECVLGKNVFVAPNVRIGAGVKIQNNVSVYEGVELEDYVFCGPSMVFTNVVNPRSQIERKHEFRKTLVKQGATLGANCTIICGNSIGRYAFVGAGSVVTKEVPDYALVVGVPARQIGWVCECGEKLLCSDDVQRCPACSRTYQQVGKNNLEEKTESALAAVS
jgi:UDP-2-acetamido-3-amino-2,3-dideoxy-glucuronate N-acetyltransferase